jgi:hypothetical protein
MTLSRVPKSNPEIRQEIRGWLARYPHLDRIIERMATDLDRLYKRGIASDWVIREMKNLQRLTEIRFAIERAMTLFLPGTASYETLQRRYIGRGPDDPMPTWKTIGFEMGQNPQTLQQYERKFIDLILFEIEE